MHFTSFLPYWNSLESVRRVHSDLEACALVSFALLVFFDVLAHLSEDGHKDKARLFEKIGLCFFAIAVLAEIAAYPYGQRNDTLSAEMIGSLDQKARDALTASNTAISQSSEAESASERAIDKSSGADTDASSALTLAQGARREGRFL